MAYSAETRRAAVAAVKAGASIASVARALGANKDHIAKWCKDPEKWCGESKDELAQRMLGAAKPEPTPAIFQPVAEPTENIVLVIPDLHCPFEHPDALEFLKAVQAAKGTNKNVCLGDELDAHALSRYPHDPDGMSPGDEMRKGREHLYPFYQAFPEMLVCESNHTVRGHKLANTSGVPSMFLRSIETVLNYPDGWKLAGAHVIDGVKYIHGDAGRSGQYAHIHYMRQAKQPIVIGHIHAFAGVSYEGDLFAMNTGCLINPEAYAFAYARKALVPVSLGCGVVYGGRRAEFIPMELNADGRWTGRL